MLGLKTDQEVLGDLVKAKAPAVGQLMTQFPGIWTLVVSRGSSASTSTCFL